MVFLGCASSVLIHHSLNAAQNFFWPMISPNKPDKRGIAKLNSKSLQKPEIRPATPVPEQSIQAVPRKSSRKTSRKIGDAPLHGFSPCLAKGIGVAAATVFQFIRWHCLMHGKYTGSFNDLLKVYPYLTRKQLRHIIQTLTDDIWYDRLLVRRHVRARNGYEYLLADPKMKLKELHWFDREVAVRLNSISCAVILDEPGTKTGNATPTTHRKVQMLRPGWRQFDRVQTLMEQEPALQRFLGVKTHEAKKRNGEIVMFSSEAVKVAEALFDKGKDATAERREVILGIAQDIFIRNEGSPGSDSNRPSTPSSSAVEVGKVHISATGDKSQPAQAQYSPDETVGMTKEPVSTEAGWLEIIHSSAPMGLPENLEGFAIEIKKRVRDQADQFVASTILIGEAFLAGTKKYNRTLKQLAAEVGLAYVTVTQYVKIAERFGRKQKCWAPAQLPASVDSLMRLARLEEDQLDDAIKTGKLKPDMGRKEVKALLAEYRPASSKTSHGAEVGKVPDEGMKTVRQQLEALREAVEVCQRLPNFHAALLLLLEGHAAWTKDCIGKLLRKTAA